MELASTMQKFSYTFYQALIDGHGDWVCSYLDNGWQGYFLTCTFSQLPGPPAAQLAQMQDEIMRVYATLVTRVVRNPRSPKWAQLLPKGIFLPDRPVPKHRKSSRRDVTINNGLHMHGIMVALSGQQLERNPALFAINGIDPCCIPRLREDLDHHFLRNLDVYLNNRLLNLHIELITHRPAYVTEYAIKALKRPAFSSDDVLILPRALSELSS